MAVDPVLPPIPDEATYRRLRGDPAPWLPAVRTLCARHGLDADDAYMPPGGTNILFHVRGGPWIKLFPPLWPEDFVRERTGIAATNGIEGLAVPQLVAEGELDGWPYLLLSHVAGRPIGTLWPDLDEATRVDVARQLGALLARLHAVDVTTCAPIHEDWPTYARALRADAVTRQAGYGLDPAWVADLAAFVADLPPMEAGREVFLHADVTDEHVHLEQRDGRWTVTGLIDFGDAMVGDWRYEFAAPLVFITQGRPAAQRALLEGYGVPPADLDASLGRSLVAWAFLHRWGRIASYTRFARGKTPTSLEALAASIWSSA